MFLCRLLGKDSIEAKGNDEISKYVEETLAMRHTSTRVLLKLLEDTIDAQKAKTESITRALNGKLSSEGQRKSWCEVHLLFHLLHIIFIWFSFISFQEICIYFVYFCLFGDSDVIIQLSKIDNMMKEEAKNLRHVIDILHSKHKEYADQIQTYISSHSVDQSEIKRLSGFFFLYCIEHLLYKYVDASTYCKHAHF